MGVIPTMSKRNPSKSDLLPPMKWEVNEETPVSEELSNQPKKESSGIDYKRRRQSYRAKMTHLTRRSVIQEHRDMINLRMQILANEDNYRLVGNVLVGNSLICRLTEY